MTQEKSAAYHGIDNAAYAVRGVDNAPGTEIKKLLYAKSIALSAIIDRQDVYADDRLIMAIPADQGYEGTFGTTDQDIPFETDVGLVMVLSSGVANVKMTGYTRFDFYHEFKRHLSTGQAYTVKAWVLNCEAGKADINNETDTNTLTIGTYSYPLRVYGEKVLDAAGTNPFRDALGNEKVATIIRAMPGDEGYDEFEKTVPVPKIATL